MLILQRARDRLRYAVNHDDFKVGYVYGSTGFRPKARVCNTLRLSGQNVKNTFENTILPSKLKFQKEDQQRKPRRLERGSEVSRNG